MLKREQRIEDILDVLPMDLYFDKDGLSFTSCLTIRKGDGYWYVGYEYTASPEGDQAAYIFIKDKILAKACEKMFEKITHEGINL